MRGRPRGAKNIVTEDVRDKVRILVTVNWPKMQEWLEEIEDPKDRMHIVLGLLEYTVPKLARTELVGQNGEKLGIQIYIPDAKMEALPKTRNSTSKS